MKSVLEYIKQRYDNPPIYLLGNGKPMKQDLQMQQELLQQTLIAKLAATKELEQLRVNDFTGDKIDEEQYTAKRKRMFEAIEREFEDILRHHYVSISSQA